MRDVRENRVVVNPERDTAEVSAAFAPPAGPRPDPCAPNFIRLCEDPTNEEICINSLYISLRGRVEDGQITQNEADRKLNEYRQRLEREPFAPGLQVFLSARKTAEETRRELEAVLEEETGVRPPPPKPRARAQGEDGNRVEPFDFAPYDERRFDMARLHKKPLVVLSLAGQAVSTPGNLTSIFAQAKAGKTAVVGAIIGSTMSAGGDGDFLSWSAPFNSKKAALIHFDSEQSPYDHEQVVLQAMRRAGLSEPPAWLHSYCLTDLAVPAKWAFIPHEMERARQRHGAIFGVLIDGLGDFVLDTNDPEEANNVVAALHALAIKYATVIVIILHENPDSTGKGNAKMRGHLGSQMERKSESNIRLVKDKTEVTTQYTGKSRHAAISEAKGPRFAFDPDEGMHVSRGSAGETPTEDDRLVVAEVFKGPEALGGLSWTACHDRIAEIEGIKRAGARKRFARYTRLKLIVKNSNAREFYIENHG